MLYVHAGWCPVPPLAAALRVRPQALFLCLGYGATQDKRRWVRSPDGLWIRPKHPAAALAETLGDLVRSDSYFRAVVNAYHSWLLALPPQAVQPHSPCGIARVPPAPCTAEDPAWSAWAASVRADAAILEI